MTFIFTFLIIVSIIITLLFIYINGGKISIDGTEFIVKGKEAGLNPKEIKLLKKAADLLCLSKPLTLLGSVNNIDDAIGQINKLLQKSNFKDLEIVDLLEELYDFRKNIELKKIDRRALITSSREIDLDQNIKITVGNLKSPITATIIENDPKYLIINLLHETTVKPGLNWMGPINIYFWKKNDAGYFFETVVSECLGNKKWKIAHSDTLIRSQKRADVRIDIELNGYVYILDDIIKRNSNPMGFTGMFVQIKNISEGGIAFYINGIIKDGVSLKIEFDLNGKIIVFCGLVKESIHNTSNNISFIRMKIIDPVFEMISEIKTFLYIRSRDLNTSINNNVVKDIENKSEINNNIISSDLEEVSEVEYLTDDNEI